MRPVIGISCYGEQARWGAWDVPAVVLHRAYVESLEAAGAAVVVLPPVADADSVAAAVSRLDAVVIAGGADIDPAYYSATPHETTDRPRTDRDATERAIYLAARERGLPVLGICRGMQMMAVVSGGSLIQDLPSAGYGTLHREKLGEFTDHKATFTPGSLVAQVLEGTASVVNSSHHQAVADAGSLTVTGYAEDGTIEVVEDPSAPFVLGVQWHPEMTDDLRLFSALVAAARR
ncbi:MAG: gamma-glutamyl-gamma-aminobutyrate hydrolase family protein [Candidatus Nanopelagicales bacterium]